MKKRVFKKYKNTIVVSVKEIDKIRKQFEQKYWNTRPIKWWMS